VNARYDAKEITVNNNYAPADPLAWVRPLLSGAVESIILFDNKKRFVDLNDRFGTFAQATYDDMRDVFTVAKYYEKIDPGGIYLRNAIHVYFDHCPRLFEIGPVGGWMFHCRIYPVFKHGRFGGIVCMTHRTQHDGPTLQVGGNNSAQLTATNADIHRLKIPAADDVLFGVYSCFSGGAIYLDLLNVFAH